jgi:hypothetical protein
MRTATRWLALVGMLIVLQGVPTLSKPARGGASVAPKAHGPKTATLNATRAGALTQMRSLNENLAADALALTKSRLDVAAAAAYFLTPSVATFGSIGRTISQSGPLGTALTLNGGISMTFAGIGNPKP